MSLLDDARRLTLSGPCPWCEGTAGHYQGCPWFAMPKIVAALEAAERVVNAEWMNPTIDAIESLRTALRGEGVPA